MKRFCAYVVVGAMLFAGVGSAQDYTNTSSVLDGAGHVSSGGSLTNVSAVAQPGGVSVSTRDHLVNYAGFLNTFSLRPDLDTDSDGVEDEADADNDGDMLDDMDELAGHAFDPTTPTDVNLADSDNDGLSDSEEAAAGTNPHDDTAHLRMTRIEEVGGKEIHWVAREGKTYTILAAEEISQLHNSVHDTGIPATGGTGPWQIVTNTYMDTSAGTNRFYAVEVEP